MSVAKKPSIIVAGYIVCGPIGGLVWHHLQYVLGLRQLGYDVLFVEDSQDYSACYNPQTFQLSTDPSYGLNFIRIVFNRFGLSDHWAYFDYHTNNWFGQSKETVEAFADKTEIYLNLSGVDPLREHFENIPVRIFVDTDPAFTQIRNLTESKAMLLAKRHNRFFSFGENFGKEYCLIPDDGFAWLPTRQPVVLNAWQVHPVVNGNAKWTTIMQWDSYKVREFEGKKFGMKSASFDAYRQLPKNITDQVELALGSVSAPREALLKEGWHLIDPLPVSLTPQNYQAYIAASKGEWSVAKHGYVVSNSGWFSERSCGYLASGKPVIVQDTGFSSFLPTGNGLLSFTSVEEVIEALQTVNKDYSAHCREARKIAEDCFDAHEVLSSLLQRL